jgi:hypothetical protein
VHRSAKLSKRAVNELVQLVFPEQLPEGSVVELVIRVDDQDVNIRELSAYLVLCQS